MTGCSPRLLPSRVNERPVLTTILTTIVPGSRWFKEVRSGSVSRFTCENVPVRTGTNALPTSGVKGSQVQILSPDNGKPQLKGRIGEIRNGP